MAMELLFQVAEEVENNMLRNSNCKATEAVIFQSNLSILLRLGEPFIRKEGSPDTILRDWQADLEHYAPDNLHSEHCTITFPPLDHLNYDFCNLLMQRSDAL